MTEQANSMTIKLPEDIEKMSPAEMIQLIEERKIANRALADTAAAVCKDFFADITERKDKLFRRYQELYEERERLDVEKRHIDQRLITAAIDGTRAELEELHHKRDRVQADMISASEQMEAIAAHRVDGSAELLVAADSAYKALSADNDALAEYAEVIQRTAQDRANEYNAVVRHHVGKGDVPDIKKAFELHTQPEEFRGELQRRLTRIKAEHAAKERAWVERKTAIALGVKQINQPATQADEDVKPRKITVYRKIVDPITKRPRRVQVDPETGEPLKPLTTED